MPEETIQLDTQVPYVSILAENGDFDEELAPEIPKELLQKLFRFMVLARRFEDKRLTLQRQGKIGTFAPVTGQEAANLGPIAAIEESDWFVPSFREPAAMSYRGAQLENMLVYDGGFNEGAKIPEGAHDLPVCVPVASQLPHAVGIAYSRKLQEHGPFLCRVTNRPPRRPWLKKPLPMACQLVRARRLPAHGLGGGPTTPAGPATPLGRRSTRPTRYGA